MKSIIFTKPFGLNNSKRKLSHRLGFDIRRNILTVIFLLFLVTGIIIGAICAKNADQDLLKSLDFLFVTNIENRKSMGAFSIFAASFASSFLFLAVAVLLALSAWGSVLAPLVPLFKGFGFGLTAGYLYSAYGFGGIGYNLLIILPGAFLSALAVLIISQESCRFSFMLAVSMRKNTSYDISSELSGYIIRVVWTLIVLTAASLVDMLFSLLFSGLFSF